MALLYRLLPWPGVRRRIRHHTPWIKALDEADLVGEIRGGDSFSDIYGLKRFLVGSIGVLTVIWVRGAVALLPQTYGPFSRWPARAVARYVLHHASAILARDQESLTAVKELTRGRRSALFCPDVAFALESIMPAQMEVRPPLPTDSGDHLIGLNVNGLVYNGGYTRANMFGMKLDYRAFLPRLIEVLLRSPDHRLLLVPHTFAPPWSVESDPGASEDVLRQLPVKLRERVHLISREYDQNEIKGIIGLCDFFVGSRMHACVAALSQAKPAIGVAYSKKFVGVFDSVGMTDWVVDGREVDTEEALRRVEALFARRREVGPVLQGRVKETRQRLAEVFSTLLTGPQR